LLTGVAGLGLVPPANGVMLVLPITTADAATTLNWVRPAGAFMVAPGPYRGAFVIAGNRSAILSAAFRNGALVIAARVPGCGTGQKDSL
jgi:hypothetical protein